MRIGKLAKQAGVSTSKIRFYEARGLLLKAARQANGYRDYDRYALRIVTFIDRAQSLGFTLREVATHLQSPEGEARKVRVQDRLEAKLVEIDAHLEEVSERRAMIVGLIAEVQTSRDERNNHSDA